MIFFGRGFHDCLFNTRRCAFALLISPVVVVAGMGTPAFAGNFGTELFGAIMDGIDEGLSDTNAAPQKAAPPAASRRSAPRAGYAVTTRAAPPRSQFGVGSKVFGQWSNGRWYPARIESLRPYGNYFLIFADGDTAVVRSNQVRLFNWGRGSSVECKLSDGRYYPGQIVGLRGNNLTVRYSNGAEMPTRLNRCRVGAGARSSTTAHMRDVQRINESAAGVPSDPEEFLRLVQ